VATTAAAEDRDSRPGKIHFPDRVAHISHTCPSAAVQFRKQARERETDRGSAPRHLGNPVLASCLGFQSLIILSVATLSALSQ
jgi:hypothetical protein